MPPLAAGAMVAGKYRLDCPLAQGGMGSVWVAFDTKLEVPVAVKLMAPALAASPELVGRFEREAKAAAQLRSPHVVQVFEHGIEGGTPFMVLELLDGEDLGARLRKRGRLSLWEAAVILEQVSKALRKAHEAGIVHRDLKPANIFLARHDEDEIVKVLDFGIAKSARSQPDAGGGDGTRTGVVMGSPAYMSPEQVRSTKSVDHRSDLWSLALVMFRVVTGKLAFSGENDNDIMIKLCTDPIPVPSALVAELPAEIDTFFARALQRDPEMRFQSAREMAAAFGLIVGRVASLAEQGGIEAPAPPQPERTESVVGDDYARTVPLGAAPAGVVETTQLYVGPGETVPAAPQGATLTGASGMAMPSPGPSRGWVMWGLGACLAVGAIATVAVVATRGSPRAVGAPTNSAPAASAANDPRPPMTAEAAAASTPVVSTDASTNAPASADAPVTSARAPALQPAGALTRTAGSAAKPKPATPKRTADPDFPNIPRVLPTK